MSEQCQRCKSKRVVSTIVTARAAVVHRDDFSVTEIPEVMGITDPATGQLAFELCLECGQIQGSWPCPAMALDRSQEESPSGFRQHDRGRHERRLRAFGVR
jgi:hypothetical protein